MTLGALVPMGRACMRVSVFGLGKAAMPCRAMWSVIVVTIEGVTDSRPYLRQPGQPFLCGGGGYRCSAPIPGTAVAGGAAMTTSEKKRDIKTGSVDFPQFPGEDCLAHTASTYKEQLDARLTGY